MYLDGLCLAEKNKHRAYCTKWEKSKIPPLVRYYFIEFTQFLAYITSCVLKKWAHPKIRYAPVTVLTGSQSDWMPSFSEIPSPTGTGSYCYPIDVEPTRERIEPNFSDSSSVRFGSVRLNFQKVSSGSVRFDWIFKMSVRVRFDSIQTDPNR